MTSTPSNLDMEDQYTTDARHDGESTPRSESIPNYDGCCESKEAEEPHNTAIPLNSEYFSPQPRRHIGSQWTTGVEGTPAASPSASQESLLPVPEGQQVHVQQASEAQDTHDTGLTHLTIRPALHQSFSEMSTSSIATVRPHPDDQHLPDLSHYPVHPVDATTSRADTHAYGQHGHPHYPQQAYIALQSQQHPTPYSYQRTRSSHPSHYSSGGRSSNEFDVATAASGSKTVGNSPANSPGLYHVRTPRLAPSDSPEPHAHGFSSPSLHWTHNHVPKETQKAEISRSGDSKVVNQYQILGELGRGAHGKVKRAINMETQKIVAIKIVERKTKKKTLGKDPSHEDKIKREVAILKKARHPHIVGLIEVIDDPQAAKVYIVLEHVELGEVKWATDAYDEVGLLEYRRFLRQKHNVAEDEAAIEEDKRLYERAKKKRLRRERAEARQHARWTDAPSSSFSLEHGGASEEEDEEDSDSEFDDESVTSYATDNGTVPLFAHEMGGGNPHMTTAILVRDCTQTSPPAEDPNSQMHAIRESDEEEYEPSQEPTPVVKPTHTGLEGTMYGAYENDLSRAPSAASIHCPVKLPRRFEKVWRPFRQVPLMTINDTRNVFRDTLLGLEYLHYQGVIHRDIKPANLLQAGDHHVKISDFGVSYLGASLDKTATKEDMDDDTELAKTVGTMEFYAPELCNPDIKKQAKVDGQIDVWALGVTLHCLVYGRLPFDSEEPYAVMTQIWEDELYLPRHRLKAVEEPAGSRPTSRHQPYFQSLPADKRKPEDIVYEPISDELHDLLRRLLTKDPTKRIKLIEIKHHPWVLDGIPNPDEWIRETDPARQAQGRRIEISKEDVAEAVVPLGLFDRVWKGIQRIMRPRARAQSTATNEDLMSAASSTSSLSRNSRRPSVKPDDLREALKASRDPNMEHPLAQSLTASPEIRNIQEHDFFDESFRATSPANSHDGRASISAAGVSRPHVHRAMTTTTSSSGSQRTIRASALPNRGGIASALLPSTPLAVDTHAEPILGLASAIAVGEIEHPLGASVETSPVSDEPYYPKGSSEEEQGISASTSQQSLPEEARFVGAAEPEPLIHHAPQQVVRDYTSADDYEGYEGSDDEDSDDSDEGLSFGRKKK